MRKLAVLVLSTLLVSGACSRGNITPDEWKALSPQEKALIVESLRGHEAARDAKGGFGRLHPKTNDDYIQKIDARYSAGDARSVTEIWEDLVEPKSGSSVKPGLPRA